MVENIKHNFKEQYKPDHTCISCNLGECDQKHILECKMLIGKTSYYHTFQTTFSMTMTSNAGVYSQSYDGESKKQKKIWKA